MSESELKIVPVEGADVKRALALYSSQENNIIAGLYLLFEGLRSRYWSASSMLDIVVAVTRQSNKVLAHYTPRNGYAIPHCIEFNSNFIALNWSDTRPIEGERTLVQHVLLHEMIHHWQHLQGETFDNQQAAHGRSFRREAARVGLAGHGRLMACPYPVKMPQNLANGRMRVGVAAPDPGEAGDGGRDNDDSTLTDEGKNKGKGGRKLKAVGRGADRHSIGQEIIELAKGYRDRRFGLEDLERGVWSLLEPLEQ